MDMLREARLAEWATSIQDWKESGLTQKQWCEKNNIRLSTLRYRIGVLNREASKRLTVKETNSPALPSFACVSVNTEDADWKDDQDLCVGSLCLEVNHVKIHLGTHTNLIQLRQVLEVVKTC